VNGERREQLRERLLGLGFDVVRFALAGKVPNCGLRDWLAVGNHADMAWLERTADKRLDPQLVLPGATTVIVLGVNYWPGHTVSGGRFARYALHADYHDTIRPALEAGGRALEESCGITSEDFRYYVDAGPVMERGWAAVAGIGFRGKNGNLISPDLGNWLLLAAILVRVEIEPDEPLSATEPGRTGLRCGKCTRCLTTCPTRAFVAPGMVDARRCISYHTIENRGFIPRELRAKFGARVFGCDECLAVCPWNRFARIERSTLLERRHDLADLGLLELLRLTPERFRNVFRGTAVKRTKLAGLLRNACIAAGNTWCAGGGVSGCGGDAAERDAAVAELLRLARHEAAIVRGHAVWALRRVLGDAAGLVALTPARAGESDPAVMAEYEAPGTE
jgi:epoxyqueuosine reductase